MMRHGVGNLQKVKEIDGCSSGGGGCCGYVGSRCVGVSCQVCGSTANSEGVVYLCQR